MSLRLPISDLASRGVTKGITERSAFAASTETAITLALAVVALQRLAKAPAVVFLTASPHGPAVAKSPRTDGAHLLRTTQMLCS